MSQCTIIWCFDCVNIDHSFFVCWHFWPVTALLAFLWFLSIFKLVISCSHWIFKSLIIRNHFEAYKSFSCWFSCFTTELAVCLLLRQWHCDKQWGTLFPQGWLAYCLVTTCSNLSAGSAVSTPVNFTHTQNNAESGYLDMTDFGNFLNLPHTVIAPPSKPNIR
jgi:hypothetical protein